MGRAAGGGRGAHIYFLAALIDGVTPSLAAMGKNFQAFERTMIGRSAYIHAALTGVSKALQAGEALAMATVAAVAILGAGYAMAASQTASFEKQLINMHSIMVGSGGTIDQMWNMGEVAVGLSMKFNKSADEIAGGLYHLASAGLTYEQILQVIQPTLELAVATQGDYVKIAKDVVQVIKGFNMEMTDANHVADVMAWTIQHSLVTWDKLGEGIKFAMPWFTAAGLTFEELSAAVGLLTDRALEAGIGGRGLRQSLAMLIRSVVEDKKKFDELGISVVDATGNIKPLLDILKQFKAAFPEMNVEAISVLMDTLGIRGATAFSHMVSGIDEYERKLQGVQTAVGTTTEIATEQMKSAAAQMTILKNELLAPFKTQKFADQIGILIERIAPLIREITPMVAAFIFQAGKMLDVFLGGAAPWMNTFKVMLTMVRSFVSILMAGNGAMFKFAHLMLLVTKVGRLNNAVMGLSAFYMNAETLALLDQEKVRLKNLALKYKDNVTSQAAVGIRQEAITSEIMLAQAQRTRAIAQAGLNMAMSLGVAALWAYAEGERVIGTAIAFVTAAVAAYTVVMAINNAMKTGLHPLAAVAIGGVVAASIFGLLSYVGAGMAREREKMDVEMAEMEASMAQSKAAAASTQVGGGLGGGGSLASSQMAQDGGYVEREGFAYIHKGETVIPEDGGAGIYVSIDLRNSVVTNDAAKTLAKEVKRQFTNELRSIRRLR